jgi:hypothetical protein
MIIVNLKQNDETVKVVISISGLIHWKYKFDADSLHFSKSSEDPPPYEHILGKASNLLNKKEYWNIELTNISESKEDYKVNITWYQGVEKLEEKYEDEGSLKASEVKMLLDKAKLIY